MARIGVEATLTDVKEALTEMGHEVVELRQSEDAAYCDCCVISGLDKNVMGISEAEITGAVINAQGMNAEDVCQMVNEKVV
ncbi:MULTISPECIES: YkuS family protein [Clostridia]|uniref:YkuS family protein n=1 Tax=Clostridia TaxID=186801 RepID=UPI000EA24741|nr:MULTISPECIES: YkuS family protein [Clostridia]NBJ70738.1 hypothetical protein [Roseburia sp. 1XD42-34]RKI75862.1 hypothetical protein D7V87_15085 [Clostridium sp. 1xD42-85]